MDFIKQHLHSLSETSKTFFHDRSACLRLVSYFLICMIFFGSLIKPEYATDTYADVMFPAQEIIANFLRGGRLFTLLFFVIFRGLHIPIQLVNVLSFLIAIITLVAALYLLESILRKHFIHHKVWPFILSLLIILNPFIIELFLFVEKGIMIMGILFCVIAIYFFAKYLDSRKSKPLILTFVFVALATFYYQGIVGLFIVLATLFVALKSKSWRTFLKDTVLSVIIYAIGPILNIVFIKIFSSGGRTGGEIIFQESLTKIIAGTKSMFDIFGIMPAICFWGVTITAIVLWLIYCARQRKLFQRLTLVTSAQIVYLIVVIYLAAIAPQAIQNTSAIWIVPRSTYVFASILGIILTVILANYPKITIKAWWQSITYLLTFIFITVQFIGFNRIIIDHYNLNAMDRIRAVQLGQLIRDYETKNNITITTVTPANDANLTYSYDGLFSRGDINVSAFSTDWSDVTSLGFWNQRTFTRQSPDSSWRDYCSSHDWTTFDTAQLKFSDDTLQVCWY